MAMDDEVRRRLSDNEGLYRKVNEAIERGLWPGEGQELVRFRCECSRLSCNSMVEMTVGDYEAVRADSRRFLVCQGHELAEVDTVVQRHAAYLVVEKRGIAGVEAEESDPRRP
jgi:hypothetical protein